MASRTSFTPKRGRPTADQAAAISEAILGAAAELFLAQGFDGVAMEAVAARAGLPKSTLYKRYPDKRALLRAVLEDRRATWSLEAATHNWMLTGDIGQRLQQHAAWLLMRATSPQVRAFAALAKSAWSAPADTATRLDVVGFSGMVDLLERDIREFAPAAGIRASDPRRVATLLMAMLSGWLDLTSDGRPIGEPEAMRFAETAVELLLKGSAAW